jgi:speckle-type POZ protein
MEPKVFKALLHFVYTDTLPEVNEGDDDGVAMAQGLLVAAHRYGMETLKSICGDMLCNHIDARTAITFLQLADSHGCCRLKQACIRAITDMLAKVATP